MKRPDLKQLRNAVPPQLKGEQFLQGLPRVHFDDLDQDYDEWGNQIYLQKNKPFHGVAWRKQKGELIEQEFVNGLQQGLSIKFYETGQMCAQQEYFDCYEHGLGIEWHENGKVAFVSWLNSHENDDESHAFDCNGQQLSVRVKNKNADFIKRWYPDGTLHEHEEDDFALTYAPDGSLAIQSTREAPRKHQFHDDVMMQFAYQMSLTDHLSEWTLLNWFKHLIDSNSQQGKKTSVRKVYSPPQDSPFSVMRPTDWRTPFKRGHSLFANLATQLARRP